MNPFLSLIALPAIFVLLSACERPSPDEVRKRQHLPEKDFLASIAQGKRLFDANCVHCHGAGGKGTDQGPPLVHSVYRPNHHSDLSFHYAVKNGMRQHHWHFGDMPPVSGVSAEDTAHIVAYVREMQRRAGIQ